MHICRRIYYLKKKIQEIKKKVFKVNRNQVYEAYLVAKTQVGIKEVTGSKSNASILNYYTAADKLDIRILLDDSVIPWCAAFMNWCLFEAGLQPTGKLLARSYLAWGKEISKPYEGCLVVLKRGTKPWQGHVGFFVWEKNGLIYLLGGNQRNMVCIKAYAKESVLGYREA